MSDEATYETMGVRDNWWSCTSCEPEVGDDYGLELIWLARCSGPGVGCRRVLVPMSKDEQDSDEDADGLNVSALPLDALELRMQAQRLRAEMFGVHRPSSLDRYQPIEELGRGGMGVVHLAYDRELDRRVAIKTLRTGGDAELERRLCCEARAMASLSHPNLMPVYDLCSAEGLTFIVMEYVEGVTLQRWLAARPRNLEAIFEVFAAAGEGLAAAHDAGLVHRDFKPANVMVGDDGRVRVMDLGLAELDPSVGDTVGPGTPDGSDAIAGTPRYMAPEQVSGRWVDARTDQFAFCVALYEAVYGEHPHGTGRAQIWAAAERGEIREAPADAEVPGWVRTILLRGLAPRASDRFDSMRALLIALLAGDPARAQDEGDGRLELRVTFSCDYSLDEFDEAERQRIQDLLRIVTRDARLSIETVSAGSIVLTLNISQRGADAFLDLWGRGALAGRVGSLNVLKIERVKHRGQIARRRLTGAGTSSEDWSVDQDLCVRAREGDKLAMEELFERHVPAVIRFLRTKVDVSDVEDLAQETFIRFFQSLPHIVDGRRTRAYVFGVAQHVLREHVRARARARGFDFDLDVNSISDVESDTGTIVGGRNELRLLLAGLRRLPLNLQILLERHYFESTSFAELALEYGVTDSTLRDRVSMAREKLAREIRVLESSEPLIEDITDSLDDWLADIRALLRGAEEPE